MAFSDDERQKWLNSLKPGSKVAISTCPQGVPCLQAGEGLRFTHKIINTVG